jgi:hypothetical protein
VLLAELGRGELERVIVKLDTSNTATGKVAFAKALKIFLAKSSPVFIQQLSELRNFCVHDLRNFDFDLNKYIIDKPEKGHALLKSIQREIKPGEKADSPQEGLLIATMNVIMQLRLHHRKCEVRDLEAKLQRTKAELLDAHNQSTPTEEPNSPQTPDPPESPQSLTNLRIDRPESESP